MKVAIDSGPLTGGHAVRGVGAYTKELFIALERVEKKDKRISIDAIDFQKENLARYDLAHYPYFNPFFLELPLSKPTKIIVTIHDLIPLRYPKHYLPGIKGNVRFMLQKILLRNVDAVITVSQTSRRDIIRFLPISESKVHVVYEGVKEIYRHLPKNSPALKRAARKYSLPDKFILYIGDINYNKNIIGLIKACKIAKIPLVIAGKQALDIEEQGIGLDVLTGPKDWFRFLFNIPHPELAHYSELIEYFKDRKSVIRLGFVPDKDLLSILNLASVYCQPSFYEGFGLPVLEAMVCGTPVVCANTPALTEVAGQAALFANPDSPKDIARKIYSFLKSNKLREEYAGKGLARVKKYSWKRAAKETVKVYKKLLSNE